MTGRIKVIDPFHVLGVARDASPEEIRGAYRRLARQHHPDVDPSPDANERFRAIDEAYRRLASGQLPPVQPPPGEPVGVGTVGWLVIGIAGICLLGPLLLVGGFLAPLGVLALILAAAALAGRRG